MQGRSRGWGIQLKSPIGAFGECSPHSLQLELLENAGTTDSNWGSRRKPVPSAPIGAAGERWLRRLQLRGRLRAGAQGAALSATSMQFISADRRLQPFPPDNGAGRHHPAWAGQSAACHRRCPPTRTGCSPDTCHLSAHSRGQRYLNIERAYALLVVRCGAEQHCWSSVL